MTTSTPQLLHDAVEGNSMEVKRGSPLNADRPMDTVLTHPAKKITVFNEEQELKALVPIVVTVDGMEIAVRPDW